MPMSEVFTYLWKNGISKWYVAAYVHRCAELCAFFVDGL